VFALLTDPEKLLRWMGTEAQVEPQPGGLVAGNVDPGIAENGRELGNLEKRLISIALLLPGRESRLVVSLGDAFRREQVENTGRVARVQELLVAVD